MGARGAGGWFARGSGGWIWGAERWWQRGISHGVESSWPDQKGHFIPHILDVEFRGGCGESIWGSWSPIKGA